MSRPLGVPKVVPKAAKEHGARMLALQLEAVERSLSRWKRVNGNAISESWYQQVPHLQKEIEVLQRKAAVEGAVYGATVLGETGQWTAPKGFVNVNAFPGFAADGRNLDGLLFWPTIHTKQRIAAGVGLSDALVAGGKNLEMLVRTLISDGGRQSASVMVAARPNTGYVRMTTPPSCADCIVLAGKFYRWNEGFLRHPNCDCVHVPAKASSTRDARKEGLVDDPYKLFKGLTEEQQNKLFGVANAQAIRDGADMFQVVNSKRGLSRTGLFTTEGTTRGYASRGLARGQKRATPELIYKWADGSPVRARKLLEEHGYILPGGQNPAGALRGQQEGFGALGRGGTRKAASEAVEQARLTGVRDPFSRYTMTEAERRLYDAERAWSTVLEGRNPYASPGFGGIPDPYGVGLNTKGVFTSPLTPEIAGVVESHYMRMLATNGATIEGLIPPVYSSRP